MSISSPPPASGCTPQPTPRPDTHESNKQTALARADPGQGSRRAVGDDVIFRRGGSRSSNQQHQLKDAEVTLSPEAEEALDGRVLPRFLWWQVTGKAGIDDFGVTEKAALVVSERGLDVLKAGGRLDNCDILPYEG